MSDILDAADENIETHLRCALAVRKPIEPRHGTCLWCAELCAGAYCDRDCRDDHTQWLRRQN